MKFAIAVFAGLAGLASAVPALRSSGGTSALQGDRSRRATTAADQIAPNHISLQRLSRQPRPLRRNKWTHTLTATLSDQKGVIRLNETNTTATAGLTLVRDEIYAADIQIGQQKLPLLVDTGSTDTWVLQSNFSCVPVNRFGTRTQAPVRPGRDYVLLWLYFAWDEKLCAEHSADTRL